MNKYLSSKLKNALVVSFCFAFIGLTNNLKANNLNITSTSVAGSTLTFKINWDNSWYTNSAPFNWDAVWVFIKYKDCSTANWQHASLSTTSGDHTVAGGVLQVDAVSDGKGVFIRRKSAGSGKIDTAVVTLKLTTPSSGTYNFRVFGVEMAQIVKGAFDVGDGASASTFKSISIDSTAQAAGLAAAALYIGYPALPATFPMGYNAFYCMKYEITQGEYIDFLNTLTFDQQANHTAVAPSVMATNFVMGPGSGTIDRSRNGIKLMTSGVANTTPAVYACDLNNNGTSGGANYNDANDGQNIPCNYLSWADLTAYLDWACLRPMTELEFEKNCRGIAGRVGNEYVWGTIQITQARMTDGSATAYYTNYGASNESCTNSGNGLCAYGYTFSWNGGTCDMSNRTTDPWGHYDTGGGFRVGFAATGTTNRISAGATYYGVMEMGGNLSEQTVQTNAIGSAFTGTLGDGILDASGNANTANWPAASGTILRGGDWYDAASYVQTSTRNQGTAPSTRTCTAGGRGVR